MNYIFKSICSFFYLFYFYQIKIQLLNYLYALKVQPNPQSSGFHFLFYATFDILKLILFLLIKLQFFLFPSLIILPYSNNQIQFYINQQTIQGYSNNNHRGEMPKKSQRENLLGKKLKKYNFVEKLGSGSYGTVYKALNTQTNEIIAIKVMEKAQMKQIPKLQKLVASQIAILKQVSNENVIKFVDSFSTNQSIFIATQFCNGGDLQQYCKKHGKLQQTQALIFLKQILNGFKGLHQINTMHRDFKLANVLLHNHVCKIADLGFAKQLRDKALTTTLLGTDETMAPQVHQGKQYGWGADIWSLGVVFYQMLYARPPYAGLNDYAILRNIKTTKPNYSDANVSEQALDFMQRCLVADPSRRITWKQIYNHPLLYKSDITLTTGLLRSKLSVQSHKHYYEKNQQNQRKTIRPEGMQGLIEQQTASKEKDIFQNAGEVKSADFRADSIRRDKELMDSQFAQYEVDIIHARNNKMFGITQVLPLEKELLQITKVNHTPALYQICKHCYISMKQFNQQITKKDLKQKYKYWKEFTQQPIYKKICEQLLSDQLFAESLAIAYKWELNGNSLNGANQNINRKTEHILYKEIVRNYRNQITPFLKKQSKKNKLKFIKMLKALQQMQEEPSFNLQKFHQQTDNIDISLQQKKLLQNL